MAKSFLVNIDLNKNELQNARIQNLGSAPSSPVLGQVYYNTGDNNLYVWDGAWTDLTTQGSTAPDADGSTKGLVQLAGDLAGTASSPQIATGAIVNTDINASAAIDYSKIAAPTATVSMGSQVVSNVAAPVSGTDAANKTYVDNAITGLDAKASVKAATTSAGTLATSFENGDTVDGVTLTTGDRILIKNQATGGENGIYIVAASGAPTRATDNNNWSEVPNAYVWVEQGTANADTGWVATADQGGSLDTTDMAWVQFNGLGQITAGSGLTKTGNTLNVGAGTGITVNADDIAVATTYAGGSSIATVGTIGTGTWQGSAIGTGYGGTGQTSAKAGRETGLGAAGYFTVVGSGSASSFQVTQATHGLRSSRWLIAQCQDVSTGAKIEVDTTVSSGGDVTFTFAASQTLSNYQFTIVG